VPLHDGENTQVPDVHPLATPAHVKVDRAVIPLVEQQEYLPGIARRREADVRKLGLLFHRPRHSRGEHLVAQALGLDLVDRPALIGCVVVVRRPVIEKTHATTLPPPRPTNPDTPHARGTPVRRTGKPGAEQKCGQENDPKPQLTDVLPNLRWAPATHRRRGTLRLSKG
jgi:hypothetical protein